MPLHKRTSLSRCITSDSSLDTSLKERRCAEPHLDSRHGSSIGRNYVPPVPMYYWQLSLTVLQKLPSARRRVQIAPYRARQSPPRLLTSESALTSLRALCPLYSITSTEYSTRAPHSPSLHPTTPLPAATPKTIRATQWDWSRISISRKQWTVWLSSDA